MPEHTWGADVKVAMPDYANWTNARFHRALAGGRYRDVLHTWHRQRRYLDWALEALQGTQPITPIPPRPARSASASILALQTGP